MRLIETKVGKWAAAGNIQSAPVTGLILALGYSSGGGEIVSTTGLSMIGIGFIAHIGMFIMNDVRDVEYDKSKYNVEEKPIANGDISTLSASVFSAVSVIVSLLWFHNIGEGSMLFFAAAYAFGFIYNDFSKITIYGPVALFAWGVSWPLAGANTITTESILLAAIVGLMSAWLVIAADLLDMLDEGTHEVSLLDLFDISVTRYWRPEYHTEGEDHDPALREPSWYWEADKSFVLFSSSIVIALLVLFVVMASTGSLLAVLLTTVTGTIGLLFGFHAKATGKYNLQRRRSYLKGNMAFYTLSFVISCSSFASHNAIGLAIIIGFFLQILLAKLLYGKWLYYT